MGNHINTQKTKNNQKQMKKFIKNWGPWILVGLLGGVVAFDHRKEIATGARAAGKWIGKKCGKSETSCNSETCDADVEVTSDAPKANNGQDRQQRFDRPRYTGGDKKH